MEVRMFNCSFILYAVSTISYIEVKLTWNMVREEKTKIKLIIN